MRTGVLRTIVGPLASVLVALASLAAPPPAEAQGVVRWDDAIGTPACDTEDLPACVTDAECMGMSGWCRALDGGRRGCAPPDTLFCTDGTSGPCPTDRPQRVRVLDLTLCLSDAFVMCPAPTGASAACFTAAGRLPVDWNLGDCDGDGQRNDVDPAPCETAPFIATIDPEGGCSPSRDLCKDDVDCEVGVCRLVSTTNPHEYCIPHEGAPFCCGGIIGVECPDSDGCTPDEPDGFQHCHSYCVGHPFEDRLECLRFADAFPVPADLGDCDGDGITNAEDGDPCTPDDGGVADVDAGTPGDDDAGAPSMDAGSGELDAGPDTTGLTFNGGGGCRCGIASRGTGGSAWLVAIALATIAARRRRAGRVGRICVPIWRQPLRRSAPPRT